MTATLSIESEYYINVPACCQHIQPKTDETQASPGYYAHQAPLNQQLG